jgi:IS30 family transposase
VENRLLARLVARKLQLAWSPEQVAGWLKHTYQDNENYLVSHETIYKSLFIQAPWCLEERAVTASQANARDAPLTPPHAENGGARQDHRHGINP